MFPQVTQSTLETQRSIKATKAENDRRLRQQFNREQRAKRQERLALIEKCERKIAWGMDNMDSRHYDYAKSLCNLVIAIQEHHLYGYPYPQATAEDMAAVRSFC